MAQLVYEIALVFLPVWIALAVILHEKTACHAAPPGDKMSGTEKLAGGSTSPKTVQTVQIWEDDAMAASKISKLYHYEARGETPAWCNTDRSSAELKEMKRDEAVLLGREALAVLRDFRLCKQAVDSMTNEELLALFDASDLIRTILERWSKAK